MRLQFAGIFTLGLLAIIGWALVSPSCDWRKRSGRDDETSTSHGSVNMPKLSSTWRALWKNMPSTTYTSSRNRTGSLIA